MNLEDTLLAFSEWLDSEGIIVSDQDGDDRTHGQLAEDFIREWRADPDKARLPMMDTEDPVQIAMSQLAQIAEGSTFAREDNDDDTTHYVIDACRSILEHHRGAPQVHVHVDGDVRHVS